jgi:uncharacterized repeat protein (TIGR02543 family)
MIKNLILSLTYRFQGFLILPVIILLSFTDLNAQQYKLTVQTDGTPGATVAPSGTSTIQHGQSRQIQVTNVPGGYTFSGWTTDNAQIADASEQRTSVTLTAGDATVTANFTQDPPTTYTLTVNTSGQGSVTRNPDQASYPAGSTVTLTATPAPGWSFSGWSGDASGSTNPLQVTMDGNKTITANFTQITYTLTVNTSGQGSVTRNPSQASYPAGSTVTLTATPASGWSFSGWSGDASGSTNPLQVTMDGNKTITANFTQITYTLTVNTSGQGSVTRNPNQASYPAGSTVTLSATPASGWSFSGWSGDASGSTNPLQVTMDGNKTITANFTQITYTLTVNTSGQGSVTRNPNQASYPAGSTVTLTATPAPGWSFSGWSGDASGSTNPLQVTMDGNKTITANFTQITYTLTVNTSGQGSVTRNPNQASYPAGSTVTLTATPAPGWSFSGWSGDASGSTNPLQVTMDGNKTITANFSQDPPTTYTLTVNTSGQGSVTRNPNQANYPAGSTVTLTATPASGWSFSGWSGDASGSTNPLQVTMDGNKTITANFTQITYTLTVNTSGQGSVTRSPKPGQLPCREHSDTHCHPRLGMELLGVVGQRIGINKPPAGNNGRQQDNNCKLHTGSPHNLYPDGKHQRAGQRGKKPRPGQLPCREHRDTHCHSCLGMELLGVVGQRIGINKPPAGDNGWQQDHNGQLHTDNIHPHGKHQRTGQRDKEPQPGQLPCR